MAILKCEQFLNTNTFTCINVLQHMSNLFGMSYNTNGFGFNYDSVIFVTLVIWYGGCSLGTGLCWTGCSTNISTANQRVILILFGLRFMQLGMLLCIVRFRYANKQVNQIFYLNHQLSAKNAGYVSYKYQRRNFVITTLFLIWTCSKLVQLKNIRNIRVWSKEMNILKYGCKFMSTWPLLILSWQFLRWMQVFSSSLKISLEELRAAIIKSQETPSTKSEIQIIESVFQVKSVLKFKQNILYVYGPSIIFSQVRASIWIIMNAHWYSYPQYRSKLILWSSTFVFNLMMFLLPHWVGHEISAESSEMLYDVLKLKLMREPLVFDKKLSNVLYAFLHESPKFRVCDLFYLTHRQFLSLRTLLNYNKVKGMKLFKNKSFPKPNIFECINVLQHLSRIFGISCYKSGFGFNYDSMVFMLVVIWFGGCSLGTGLCWVGCNVKVANKKIVLLLFGIRLVQAGLLICIIKFRFSNRQVKQILHLSNRLNEKNAGFISFKYHRRNFVLGTFFIIWILTKAMQLKDIRDRDKNRAPNTESYFYKYACTYMSTWPVTILNWQFLGWMQVFSSALKITADELRCAIIRSQEMPTTKHELQIFESVSELKSVLRFKEKILHVYGISIFFCQLRSSLWIILNGYWYSYKKYHAKASFLVSMFAFNVTLSFLPHWVGQEIASEGSEMLHNVLKLQLIKTPMFNKRSTNFLFGLLHESLKFRVFNLFDLTHRQFLSFLSISVAFLIIQLQMIW